MLDWIFLIAAVIGGTVLVCQFILTLLGMGDDGLDGGDLGGDFHGDGHFGGDTHVGDSAHANVDSHHPDSSWLFGVLSFRTLIAAAAFFGATGKAALAAGYAQSTSFILAVLVGLSAMYGMYWLMRLVGSLSGSGNERIDNALGLPATVYVAIPAAGNGAGKVQLSMQNRIVEYQAVSNDSEPLKSGQSVEVIEIVGSDTVRVRRAAEPAVVST